VDVDAPIIVSLVPNENLKAELLAAGARVVDSIPGNYSVSCNRGLAAVRTEYAFIVDSDCTLEPGCLALIRQMLDEAPLARARVRFLATPALAHSDRTAAFHSRVNNRSPIPAYTPGLGLRLNVATSIGGYFFDERVFWACDSELNRRVRQAGLPIAYSPQAAITHGPMSVSHLMRSAVKLGMGNRAQVKLGLRPAYESPGWLARRFLGWLRRGLPRSSRRDEDLPLRLLSVANVLAYYFGYYRVFFRSPDAIRVDHC
jgi:GT2 family glycosyltransferase